MVNEKFMRKDDDIAPIPTIVATRDVEPMRASSASRGPARGKKSTSTGSAGTGLLSRMMIAVALAIAGVACGWAWQLQQQLEQAGEQLAGYEQRVASLEDLLSDTDETVNRSSAAMGAQLKMLDTEVRKLWDARKASNASLTKLEKSDKSQAGQLANMKKILAGMKKIDNTSTAQIKTLLTDITRLKTVAGDLERLSTSAKVNQAEVERVADTLNRINLDMAKLNKRVQSNEEWVGSVNAFRRQINTSIAQLEASVRTLQSKP